MDEIMMAADQPQECPVWETFGRDQVEKIIKGNIQAAEQKMAEISCHFCATGYYLRRQQREGHWEEAGAENFADYVRDTYGKSRGWATRMMQINERYSRGGDDPRLDDKYKAYTVSQLQEMLYLPDDAQDDVTPDMTVREIRAMRQQEPEEAAGQQAEPDPDQNNSENEQYGSENVEKSSENEQNNADSDALQETLTPAAVNEDVAADFATSQKTEPPRITREEWEYLFDTFGLSADTPESKLYTDELRIKHRYTYMGHGNFEFRGSNIKPEINGKPVGWGTVANAMYDIWEERRAAAAATAEVETFAVANDMDHDNPDTNIGNIAEEEEEGAAGADPDDQWDPDEQWITGTIERKTNYDTIDVIMQLEEAKSQYRKLVQVQTDAIQANEDILPWNMLRKQMILIHALGMLLEAKKKEQIESGVFDDKEADRDHEKAFWKWIPCKERLPETADYVLCSMLSQNGSKNVVRCFYMNGRWCCGINSEVIAWMPLPEPYDGGEG